MFSKKLFPARSVFVFFLFFNLVNCSSRISGGQEECLKQINTFFEDEIKTHNSYYNPSDQLETHFIVDGSASMKGFVNSKNSHYSKIIQNIESPVNAWKNPKSPSYYKFGKTLAKIDRAVFIKERHDPSFYKEPLTNIDAVLNKIKMSDDDSKSLFVIITDLFENDGDIYKISRTLKWLAQNKNVSLGIIGIKSEFKGKVFDVGPQNLTFPYENKKDSASFRPFYVVLIGHYGDILQFYKSLDQGILSSIPDSIKQFVIFSQRFVQAPVGHSRIKSSSFNQVSVRTSCALCDKYAKYFLIRKNDSPGNIELEYDINFLPYVHQASSSDFAPSVRVMRCGANRQLVAEGMPQQMLTSKFIKLSKNKMDIAFSVDANRFMDNQAYLVEAIFTPAAKKNNGQPPMYEWDMDVNSIPAWIRNPNDFDGSTTYNLKHFLSQMSDIYASGNIKLHAIFFKKTGWW